MSVSSKYARAHAEPNGPGDDRPTAQQVVDDEGLRRKLAGMVVLITGGNDGIGLEAAKALHSTGATVVLPVRSRQKGEAAVKQIREAHRDMAPMLAPVEIMEVDLQSMSSVRKLAQDFKSKHKQLNILINNAGVMACPESQTDDGFETQFGVNHLATFLLTQELTGLMLASAMPNFASRVVNVASIAHRGSTVNFDDLDSRQGRYNQFKAYWQSNTAKIWAANEVERRYGSRALHGLSVHPGGIRTNLLRHLDAGTLQKLQDNEAVQKIMKSPAQGAATTVWAAVSAELEGKGGLYLEDCGVGRPVRTDKPLAQLGPSDTGYAPHAFDEAGQRRLWEVSMAMTGTNA